MASRNELRVGKALRLALGAAVDRYVLTGDAVVPEMATGPLRDAMEVAWRVAIRASVRQTARDIGALEGKADLWEEFVAEYVRLYGGRAIQSILEAVRYQIMAEVQRGIDKGLPLSEIAKTLREKVPMLARRRAAVIARTEVHSSAQWAAMETARRQSRWPLMKTWVSTADHRTRDFGEADGKVDQANHRAMNGVSAPMDDPFSVPNRFGGFDLMQFPGDQRAPAYQCVNCRCVVTFKRIGGIVA